MSRNRFCEVLWNLSFYDQQVEQDNIFYKMRFPFEHFRSKIMAAFEPDNNLCVDEILYAFRGNCRWRQYLPSKPAKYGQKYWCLTDVNSSYLCNFDIYLGRDSTRTAPVGESVVLKLTEPFVDSGRNVTMDNFFSSIALAEKLWDKRTTMVGTIKYSKPEMPSVAKPNRSRTVSSSQFFFHNFVTLVSYVPKRNRAVNIISTEHHSTSIESSNKPAIIGAYNDTKGGVDTLAHLISNNTCRRKTNKWTTNSFFFIIDTAVHNSFVLFLMNNSLQTNERRRKDSSCLLQRSCVTAKSNKDAHSGILTMQLVFTHT